MTDGLVSISTLTLTFDGPQDQTPWVWEDAELIGRSDSLTMVSQPVDVTRGGLLGPADSYRNWTPGPVEVFLRLNGSDHGFQAVTGGGLKTIAGAGARWDTEIRGWWKWHL